MISQEYLKMLKEVEQGELEKMLSRQRNEIIGENELNKIKVEDCGEELVIIKDYVEGAIISMTKMRKRFQDEQLYVRRTVAEQLAKVAEEVSPRKLIFFDAFRPIELQQRWFDDVYNKIKRSKQDLNEEQVRAKAFVYVFPPSWNLQTPPPHSTGAAVDLTLSDLKGNELDMGTKYSDFDNPSIYTNEQCVNKEQRANRIALVGSMARNGFVNYPGEWWHFSFGDREWAFYYKKKATLYEQKSESFVIQSLKKQSRFVGSKYVPYRYTIIRPGGNDTALVLGIERDFNKRKQINDQIMKKYSKVEQVGFVNPDPTEPELLMAGREFCGNATRSAA